MDKRELRKNLHALRNNLHKNTNEFNALSDALQNLVINSELFRSAKNICTYAPTKSETDTNKISLQAWKQNKNVFYPLCSKTEKGIMHFYACRDFSDLEAGAYGILEPKQNCPEISENFLNTPQTLILVPALGFNKNGYRLGYGQGFYDRFLAKVPLALTMGITFTALLSDAVPVEPWDLPVSYLATEKEILITQKP